MSEPALGGGAPGVELSGVGVLGAPLGGGALGAWLGPPGLSGEVGEVGEVGAVGTGCGAGGIDPAFAPKKTVIGTLGAP